MKDAAALAVPLILALVRCFALCRGVDVFGAMSAGAKDGLKTAAGILPALTVLLPAVAMLRASGALDALTALLSPLLSRLGVPPETVALMLIRPVSGSGALAVGSDIIRTAGANSLTGRTAAVMLGSTETTFYVIAVYFGAAGIRDTRHAIPAALIADLAGFLAAAFFSRVFWG